MADARKPARSYLVCATPRSGSTLLCELLGATGVAGRPEEPFEALVATGRPRQPREYFDGLADPAVDRLAPLEPGAPERPEASRALWREALARGTTSNGVFAAKLMWGYFPDFLARLRTLAGTEGRDGAALVDAALAGVRYVRVKREDKVAQAVSLWRALQTQRWRDEGDAGGDDHHAEYSFAAIAHLVEQLERDDAAWTSWFEREGIAPVDMLYEAVAASPAQAVREVLDALGLDAAGAPDPDVPMRRQSDERSDEWIRWFKRERVAA